MKRIKEERDGEGGGSGEKEGGEICGDVGGRFCKGGELGWEIEGESGRIGGVCGVGGRGGGFLGVCWV